jgi:hypothetical protein
MFSGTRNSSTCFILQAVTVITWVKQRYRSRRRGGGELLYRRERRQLVLTRNGGPWKNLGETFWNLTYLYFGPVV